MKCEDYEKTMHGLKEMERQIKELPLGADAETEILHRA